ncbi:glycosyltransferase [Mesorhizobium sp. BR1-1-16]|uniref:CgeB family protein n=1 Tax=Mesorhizobium sp. BR1-1-16 TaxID=2876653 RepID=UPI001CCF72A6|nr:glycosyltransferase [Mesorhizobium sp. BR1-1-16]MBZ9936962.1 glycosyltransferase [Mesorhizobium sp. BR1-1-16]
MTTPLSIVIVGLSLSSSWGNGHATTYRALIRGLHALGHRVTFLERDVPWYAENRDLPDPDFCSLITYETVAELTSGHGALLSGADLVMIGSYVPEGIAVIDAVAPLVSGVFCFYDIDTPVTLVALKGRGCDYLDPCQIPLFDAYYSFSGGPTLRRLESDFGAWHALPLYCAVDAERYRPTGEAYDWDLGYLGTYSPDRQPALDAMLLDVARSLPDRRFVVAGPQYPDEIDWPSNVDRIGHLAPADHASFYSRQKFTLNITRRDMATAGWSPSVRLFEAAACGTPVISDAWPGLGDFFPIGKAIQVADGTDAVVELIDRMPEGDRRTMADCASRIVAAGHTGEARAHQFIRTIEALSPRVGRGRAA